MEKTKISMNIDSELLAKIDARAKSVGLSRSEWFEKCTRWSIDNLPYGADQTTRIRIAKSAPREVAGR